ncbi:ATP-dependent zinc protease family protein [Polaribacter sargassicola]|uniref:ATP-dependent zinc protease family protein n=1 Tax=Polaribacter sargassicola TaxID=2836891 RepID=UPI001F34210D|nr:RimK/LysX family protein [Polaribacter sp. DS7-9]MCG1036272.1 ATP-dependent zinc protease [Polaribacter sp. DS7-9]
MKITIGRIDKGDFPELSLEEIDLKIDSGAYTSSIHCSNIEEIVKDGVSFIKFKLLDPEHYLYNNKEFSTKNYDTKTVKSSNGISENRFLIKTEIVLFNTTFPIHLTLSERKDMKFPILLGRKFLNNKFVIDTAEKNLSFKLKNKTK